MKLKYIPINYQLMADAQKFYTDRGYEYIEAPWVVNEISSSSTCELASNIFILNDGKHLVGSGEQSFIDLSLYTDRLLSEKNYMTITPCFRRGEDDETHGEQFLKLELFRKNETLFIPDGESIASNDFFKDTAMKMNKIDLAVWTMLNDAYQCFHHLGLTEDIFSTQLIDNDPTVDFKEHSIYNIKSYDLYYDNGLELGSYGIRRGRVQKMNGSLYTKYYYGTGLALPRFQIALDRFHA